MTTRDRRRERWRSCLDAVAVAAGPAPLPERVRALLLGVTLLSLLPGLGSIAFLAGSPPVWRSAAGAAVLGLWCWWWWRWRDEHVPWWSVAVETAVLTGFMAAVDTPSRAFGVFTTSLLLRSLYGSTASVVVRLVAFTVVALTFSTLVPGEDGTTAGPAELLFQAIGLVTPTVFARVLFMAVSGSERAAARERVLARTGARLVAVEQRDRLERVAVKAVAGLLDATKSLVAPDARAAVRLVLADDDDAPERQETFELLRDHLSGVGARRLDRQEFDPVAPLLALPDESEVVLLVPMNLRRRSETRLVGALLLASPQPTPAECDGALETLAAELALALDRIRLTEDLRGSVQRYRSLVRHSSDVVLIADGGGFVRSVSESVRRVFGLPAEELIGVPVAELLHPADRDVLYRTLSAAARGVADLPTHSWRMRRYDRSYAYVEAVVANLLDDSAVGGVVLNLRDVSERKALEEQLHRQAFRDPLTGLANRALFRDRVGHALAAAVRTQPVAVLLLDLDDFKQVNDELGHGAGDALLVTVAERLNTCLRDSDTAARLGGDEFAVLLERPEGRVGAERVADRVLDALGQPFALAGVTATVGCSVGLAVSTSEDNVDTLLEHADIAMYAAKEGGKGRCVTFEPGMAFPSASRLAWEEDLRRALEEGDLHIDYQPIVRLDDRQTVGFEALVQWEHPRRGTLSAQEFLGDAERLGLLSTLAQTVLDRACRQVAAWNELRAGAEPYFLTVDVSYGQLTDSSFPWQIARSLTTSGLEPRLLVLDVPEHVVVTADDALVDELAKLRERGVRLSVVGFAHPWTAVARLRRCRIDWVKLDSDAIAELGDFPPRSPLPQALVSVARALGAGLAIERVETDEQVAWLRALGCDLAQGPAVGAGMQTPLTEGSLVAVPLA